jgi:hypothetical protein
VTVLRKTLCVSCLMFLAATDVSGAQAVARQDTLGNARSRSGTWSARAGSGLTLIGTWTAVADTTKGTVIGTWTLVDAEGRTLGGGGWSAAKSASRWTGAWRAVVSGREGEYSGTWTAGVDLAENARFVDLFETALQAVVRGTWRAGRQSGAWTIRASK